MATNSSSRIAEAADGLAAALVRAPVAEVRGAAVAVAAEGRSADGTDCVEMWAENLGWALGGCRSL